MRHLQLSKKKGAVPLEGFSFTAVLACGKIPTKNLVLSDVKFSIDGKEGVFNLNPIRMRVFGGTGSGNLRRIFRLRA